MVDRRERGQGTPREILDVKVRREVEFPTDPNERFERVFAALGNSEAKCLTLLCLSQSPIKESDLHRRFLQESGVVWRTNRSIQAHYCLDTLVPIGLVAEADTLYVGFSEYVTGFKLTSSGSRYGQPVAAYLLEQSAKLPFSLLRIFSQTSKGSGETRPVLTRAAVLEYLASQNSTQRREDIARQTGIAAAVVGHHLTYLNNLGLVEYFSVDPAGKGLFRYRLRGGRKRSEVKPVKTYPSLTSEVADILFELGEVDAHTLFLRLKDNYLRLSIAGLGGRISGILSDLTRQEICERVVFEASKIHSQAKITDLGRRIVSELILPVRQALAGDEELLASWRKIPWQPLAKEVIARYREDSGHANQRSVEDRTADALRIICDNPGIRPKEIKVLLRRNPADPLRILLDKGEIRKVREGNAVRYYPQGPPSHSSMV